MNMNTIDLTPLVEILISLLALVITTYLIPWIKTNTTHKQQEYIRAAAHVAVYAAEKFYGAGHGDQKLEYAEKVLKEDYGITLNLNKLEAVIDAAIKEMEQAESGGVTIVENIETAVEAEAEEEDEEPQTEEA
jgi:nitrogen regulatory protein PII